MDMRKSQFVHNDTVIGIILLLLTSCYKRYSLQDEVKFHLLPGFWFSRFIIIIILFLFSASRYVSFGFHHFQCNIEAKSFMFSNKTI